MRSSFRDRGSLKISTRKEWKQKFIEKASTVHKRNLPRFADRMLKRVDSWKGGLVSRSKKKGVECTITLEELREIMYEAYGRSCKYCGRTMDINNIVMDHIVPISKAGNSNQGNLHAICKASNSMKGSLDESSFHLLLEWLETVPPELKRDISIRLAGGIC